MRPWHAAERTRIDLTKDFGDGKGHVGEMHALAEEINVAVVEKSKTKMKEVCALNLELY